MCNTNLLKSELAKKGFSSQRAFCKIAGFNVNTFNLKLNNNGTFNTDEINAIAEALDLNPSAAADARLLCQIFLPKASQK